MLAATCRRIAVLALLVSIPMDAYAQAPRVTLTEDDPRALSLMAQDIARRTRSTITFEELVYPDAGDWRFYPDKNPALPLPTHEPFTFTYAPQDGVSKILATLLAQFHQQSAGTYRVLER